MKFQKGSRTPVNDCFWCKQMFRSSQRGSSIKKVFLTISQNSEAAKVFYKKGVLKNFTKFKGKHLWHRTPFKNTFFTEHLWTAASGCLPRPPYLAMVHSFLFQTREHPKSKHHFEVAVIRLVISSQTLEYQYKILLGHRKLSGSFLHCNTKKNKAFIENSFSENLY